MAMKVSSISLTHYGSSPSGTLSISGEGNAIVVTLEESDALELMSLGLRIFERKQAAIAKSIADMRPLQLAGPEVPHGDWEEVPTPSQADLEDEVPF